MCDVLNLSIWVIDNLRRVLLAVRKPDFHSGKTGSIPVRAIDALSFNGRTAVFEAANLRSSRSGATCSM